MVSTLYSNHHLSLSWYLTFSNPSLCIKTLSSTKKSAILQSPMKNILSKKDLNSRNRRLKKGLKPINSESRTQQIRTIHLRSTYVSVPPTRKLHCLSKKSPVVSFSSHLKSSLLKILKFKKNNIPNNQGVLFPSNNKFTIFMDMSL